MEEGQDPKRILKDARRRHKGARTKLVNALDEYFDSRKVLKRLLPDEAEGEEEQQQVIPSPPKKAAKAAGKKNSGPAAAAAPDHFECAGNVIVGAGCPTPDAPAHNVKTKHDGKTYTTCKGCKKAITKSKAALKAAGTQE